MSDVVINERIKCSSCREDVPQSEVRDCPICGEKDLCRICLSPEDHECSGVGRINGKQSKKFQQKFKSYGTEEREKKNRDR